MPEQRQPTKRTVTQRRERRKKPGQLQYGGGKLSVDESKLDKDFTYRWVNDTGGRIQELEARDWDVVNDTEIKPGTNAEGTVVSVHGGKQENGQGFRQVLMMKRKDWYEEDQKERQAPLEEIEEQLKSGQPITEKPADQALAQHSYTPGGGNSINVTHEEPRGA